MCVCYRLNGLSCYSASRDGNQHITGRTADAFSAHLKIHLRERIETQNYHLFHKCSRAPHCRDGMQTKDGPYLHRNVEGKPAAASLIMQCSSSQSIRQANKLRHTESNIRLSGKETGRLSGKLTSLWSSGQTGKDICSNPSSFWHTLFPLNLGFFSVQ